MNHRQRVLTFIGKSRDLTSLLAASVDAAEKYPGAVVLQPHQLPNDEQLEAARALVEACVGAPELEGK